MISFVKIGASCSLTKTGNVAVPQGNIAYTGCPKINDVILIVNNCFRF